MHENGSEPVPMVQEVCVWLAEKMEKIGWIVKKKRKNEKNKNKKTASRFIFVTLWKILLLPFSLTFESLFFR